MNNKSFSNRLSWRIIGIAGVVFFVSFIAIGLISQYALTHAADVPVTLVLGSNLVIVGVVALAVLYFLCRKEIRRMTRPITELSVSALNMGKGNFKAQLPEITSKDEMLRLRNSFVYMQNSISDYIGELKTTRSDNERMESELNVARTIQMGMLNTHFRRSFMRCSCPPRRWEETCTILSARATCSILPWAMSVAKAFRPRW